MESRTRVKDNFSGVVLIPAAGRSRRMPGQNKLTLSFGESTILGEVIHAFIGAGCTDFVLVSDSKSLSLPNVPEKIQIRLVINENGGTGLGSSIAKGLQFIAVDQPVLVCLADLPLLRSDTVGKVIDCLSTVKDGTVVRPRNDGKPGHPAAFTAGARYILENLTSDVGARNLLEKHPQIEWLDVADSGIWQDIDDMATYQQLRARKYN